MADPSTITFDSKSHVLLPFLPDWTSAIEGDRERLTGISKSRSGKEDRSLFQPKSLIRLSNLIAPADEEGRIDMIDALLEAKRSQFVAMPFWGWGIKLGTLTNKRYSVENNDFPWAVGMNTFLSNNDWANHEWETGIIDTVYDGALELDVTPSLSTNRLMWPLLFGEFDCGDISALSNLDGEIEVEVKQLIPFDDASELVELIELGGGFGIG